MGPACRGTDLLGGLDLLGGMAGLVSRSLGHSLALTWAGLGLGLDHGRGLELALRRLG